MAALWGADAQWQVDTGEHPHEAHYLKLDISKARSRLNWHPALSLKDALALIIDWSKQNQSGANMRQLTLAQLQAYQALTS
jgi:CDP-glucose 4,6-dehydratase